MRDGLFRQRRQWARCVRAGVVAVSMAMLLSSCGSSDSDFVYEDRPVEELYNTGMDQLEVGEYEQAARNFEEVERQHPFSIWAPRAQLMSGYAYFRGDMYDDAVLALDRFLQLHPSHPDAAYAYYLRASTYYEQIVDVSRDQTYTRQALEALDDVIRRYPESDYARDARLKRDLTIDHLAGKEMEVGRYYLRDDKVISAINRFTYVLVNYQATSHAPEALHRLVEAYMALGLPDEARKYAAVLGHNFPSSEWYSDSYELLTGERVQVAANPEEDGFFTRSYNYLFVPNYTIGTVDPDATVEGGNIESDIPASGARQQVTRAAVPRPGEDARLDAAQVSSTVPELSVAATSGGATPEQKRQQIDDLLASAKQQRATATAAAAAWNQYAASPGLDAATQERAQAQAITTEAAASYWAAREDLLSIAQRQLNGSSVDAAERARAESAVAETGVSYWRSVAQYGETSAERDMAAKNAADAEEALTFWQSSGQGWLDRVLGSST
jgi:outer membrane protein assembly factor BamD